MPSFPDDNPGQGFGGPRYPGTFLLALREALAKLNWQATAWKGSSVDCLDATGQTQQIGLENMYRRLRQEPRDTWPDLLAELLGSVPPEVATPPGDLSEVADRLLVRLGPPFTRRDANVDVWSIPLVEDELVALLVIDYPTSMSYVTEKMIADSQQSGEYWYELALTNLRSKTDENCISEVHEESGLLHAQAGDAYDSSRALLIDHLVPGHADNGFFVVVPGRDHLFFVPITEKTLMLAPWMHNIAGKMHRELPYPISPQLFWVRGGIWHPFVIEREGEDLLVKPPAEFAEVMARLNITEINEEEDQPPPDDGSGMSI